MSRLGSLALVVLVLGGFALYVFETEPRWYERLRYPLRYEQIVETLGGHGELVRAPGELRDAFERALASGRPALINVLTDPAVAYPRRSNLA